jgi:hypothetical protein
MSKPERSPKKPAEQAQSVCTTELTQPCPVTSSHYSGAWDARPTKPISGTWESFVDGLDEGRQRTGPAPRDDSEEAWQDAKAQLPGFVCAAFEGRRRNTNAGPHTAIVIDVDNVPDAAALTARLQRWRCVAYESPSSFCRGYGLRLRVVVALTEPVPPQAVKAARSAFARELGLDPAACGVEKANAVSQIMFIGRVYGTPERRLWSYDGEPWTPPPPDAAPPAREVYSSDAPAPQWGEGHVPDLSAVAKAVGELDEHGMRRGGRDVSRALGGYLARRGYHPDAIEQAVREQIPSDQAEVRAEQARQCAEQVFDGDPNGAGYTALESHFGEAVMAELEGAVADPWITMMIAKWPPSNDINASEPAQPECAGLWRWIDADELATPLPPVEYRCEALGFVLSRDHRPDMIVGPAGYGKTGLAQAYALAVASGQPLFGTCPTKPGIVYHIDNEQGLGATQYRYQLLAGGMGVDLRDLRGKLRVFADGVRLTRGDQINEPAVEALRRNTDGADVVIIDSLITLGLGINENDVAFGEVLMRLRDITRKGGPKFLVLHHAGKSEGSADGRGSSAIDGERGSTWVGSKTFTWRHKKKSLSDTADFRPAFTTEWAQTDPAWKAGKTLPTARIVLADGRGPASGVPTADERRLVTALVKDRPDGISREAVKLAIDGRIPEKRLRGVIDTLVSDEVLTSQGTGKLQRLIPGVKINEVLS